MRYQMDDVESEGLMKVWREFALAQISDCSPRDVAALFDLGKRLPGMFLKHHVGVFGQAANFVEQQKQLHVAAIHAVTTRDLIAPFLTKDQLTDPLDGYAQFVGMPRVESEINYAYCSGLNIHPEALEFARIWINKIPSRWMKGASRTLYPLNAPLMLSPSQPQPTIGTQTRLTAVEAPVVQPVARAVEEPVLLPEPDADFDWQPTVAKEPVVEIPVEPRLPRNGVKEPQFEDIAKLIVDDIYSYAIIGPSGSGKGMLWSHVVREARKKLPHLTTMLIDPKDFEPERGYAEGCFDIVHRTKFRKLSEVEQSEWLDEALNIYRDIEGHALLIFDEATLLFSFAANQDRKLLGRLKNLITVTASSGNAEERYVFLIGHSPNLGDYGISSGQMSSFKKIGIYPNNDLEKIKQIGLTTFAGGQFGEDKAREINRVAQKSPVGRAVYVGTRDSWLPMSRLQNYSSYDRDNRRVISQDLPTKPPCATENQLQTLAQAGDLSTLESIKKTLEERVAMGRLKGR
jgi:hypothetical protein